MESSRNVERGDQGRAVEEEKSKNMVVGHQNASYSRPTDNQADVNNLPDECNSEEERRREGAISQRRISIECNIPSHESQEYVGSRSNSRNLPGNPRGMTIDTQPRPTFPNSNRQDRGTINRGAEGNFYISPRLTFPNLNRHDRVNNTRMLNKSVREGATSLISIEDNARSQASQNHSRIRSKSRDLPGISRGMNIDIPPRLICLNPNRHDRVNNNRGGERNCYNLRNWITKSH